MKKAQQKAQELVEKYQIFSINHKKLAKQCAIIAVDFAISKIDWHDFEAPNKELEELEQIKIEIEKL